MAELKKFTKEDYFGFAGVEGDNPMIGELSLPEKVDVIIIVDLNAIEITVLDYTDGPEEDLFMTQIVWTLFVSQPIGELIAKEITLENFSDIISKFGFTRQFD